MNAEGPDRRRPPRGWFAAPVCVVVGILSLVLAGLLWFALALSGGEAVGSSPVADGMLISGVAVLGLTLFVAAATMGPQPRAGRIIALVCLVGGSVLFVLLGLRSEGFLFYVLLWAPFAVLLLVIVVFGPRTHGDGGEAEDPRVEERYGPLMCGRGHQAVHRDARRAR